MAGKARSLAFCTSPSSCAAPSSRLYSEWTCRWTKSARGADLPASLRSAPITYPLASPAAAARQSFPLDRARRLGGDVEDDAVDALHLVDDAAGDPAEEIVGEPGPV